MVGKTEEQLTARDGPLRGRHRAATARSRAAQIIGDDIGHAEAPLPRATRASCWACTSSASARRELIHIGQAVMSFGGGLDYFVDTVFNYPTLAEATRSPRSTRFNRLGPA